MTINKQQWQAIEQELTRHYCHVKWQLGEHVIEVMRERVSESEHHLVVYIDGKWNAGWGWTGGAKYWPLVEKVWCKRSKSVYPPAKQKDIIKTFGKRRAAELFPKLEKVMVWYQPNFKTAKPLISQLKKLPDLVWLTRDNSTPVPEVNHG